ncbi:hypothetical protein J3Q64DRAFT_1251419 [Phycomyces blakesleeanus]|uniref:General stress protein FMN-binding split barrel domain-containing protein n=2 Tax=Phycomyces blakesleeanus TaxID=4837 RepID=A0A167KUC3_PHYB8|nr:hypothetical protein PHYBLDRAFT_188502 [Phycomyces blakesleeanus NRRL 1555(-)]OAD68907.1 hypothetical protein PHYBLDRAFT_188502 [Phycomyces blakesleeanus NRRL 1555(-)]|eukprot:XP_018286947.1 hypothetical protein PHYBLDRAFT_188502 [Phycomyces blakesleeanus NRRL 1555(-)]
MSSKTSSNVDLDPIMTRCRDLTTSTQKKIEDLYMLTKDMNVCMLTTHTVDSGALVSRAMHACKPQSSDTPADIWFFANVVSKKFEEIKKNPSVNISYVKQSTMEWISIAGHATHVTDRSKIKELYRPELKIWYGDLGDGVHDSGPDDPRINLIHVKADTVSYSIKDVEEGSEAFDMAKAMLTGQVPKLVSFRTLSSEELSKSRSSA